MKNGSVHLEIEQSAPAQATHQNPPPSGALLLEEDHFIGLGGAPASVFSTRSQVFLMHPQERQAGWEEVARPWRSALLKNP